MGGFREWWDKMMGKGGDEYKEETGISQPSEDELDQYHEQKADRTSSSAIRAFRTWGRTTAKVG